MADKQVQRRRGTTIEHATFTGAQGEITVDTTKHTAVVHDGATVGGFPLAKESAIPAPADVLSPLLSAEVAIAAATVLTGTAFGKMHTVSGAANYTITLPTAVGNAGKWIGIRFLNTLTGIITVDGNASETISGTAAKLKTANSVVYLLSDGTNFIEVPSASGKKSSFSANKNGVNQAISTGTFTKVTFTTEVYDTLGDYDAPNSKYTPAVPGLKLIVLSLFNTASAAGFVMQLLLYKNGAFYRTGGICHASGTAVLGASAVFQDIAAAGDYYEAYTWFSTAESVNGTTSVTTFSATDLE